MQMKGCVTMSRNSHAPSTMAKTSKVIELSESDSDAPETIALGSAKGNVLDRDRAVEEFHASSVNFSSL